jgi:hypothetical protein
MVLHAKVCGRVGRCRHKIKASHGNMIGLFLLDLSVRRAASPAALASFPRTYLPDLRIGKSGPRPEAAYACSGMGLIRISGCSLRYSGRTSRKGQGAFQTRIFFGAQIGRIGNAEFVRSNTAVFKFLAILHEHAGHVDFYPESHPIAGTNLFPENASSVHAAAGFIPNDDGPFVIDLDSATKRWWRQWSSAPRGCVGLQSRFSEPSGS